MTMRKRIFISNTAMVLISLLILFGVGGVSVLLFKEEFMDVVEQNSELSDYVYEIQTLLMEEQSAPGTWDVLSRKLEKYDFHLYVSDEEQKEQYSNVGHSEWECIEELEDTKFTSEKIKLYSMENVTIARCIIKRTGMDYYVYATYHPGDLSLWGMDRGMFEMFIIVFIIAGVMIITGLLLCSQIFTKLMIRRIMKPVEELNMAVSRINEGNFNEPIVYQEQEEFREVCDMFNRMQEHLKEGIQKSQAYEKARTEMISGISHDLRTPLTSVKAYIKGMLDGIASTPEKKKQYLEISYQKACDMEALLQKLFFFSKLETGNIPFFLQKVDFLEWIEKFALQKKAEGITKNYNIEIKKENQSYPVNIDVEQMKRVFDNLIENTIKYADVPDIWVRITLGITGKKVGITFEDNGVGISDDKLAHVFEQFYRGDESRNSKNEGSGLGLYVCKYIVEEHGGKIAATNKQGFCVEIEIPYEK